MDQINETMQYQCKTPIVFIFFNRPQTMIRVLEQIAKVKPPKIYLIADGPRNEAEKEKTDECRSIAEQAIKWDCKVIKLYSDENLGCCMRIYTGITYALNREEKVIILEDDIVPSISFFRFQDEMLEKYRYDDRIFSISGFNRSDYVSCENADYYFVHYFACWGWGTWAEKWRRVDIEMSAWEQIKGHPKRMKLSCFDRKLAQEQYYNFNKTYMGITDSWANRVAFWLQEHELYSIMPRSSLTECIGFGEGATHTKTNMKEATIVAHELTLPLKSPNVMENYIPWMKAWAADVHDHFYYKKYCSRIKDIINALPRNLCGVEFQVKRNGKFYGVVLKKFRLKRPDKKIINEIVMH